MTEQEFSRPRRQVAQEEAELPEAQTGVNFDVEDFLDDIDSILEENATSFVQGFVQKGGQ